MQTKLIGIQHSQQMRQKIIIKPYVLMALLAMQLSGCSLYDDGIILPEIKQDARAKAAIQAPSRVANLNERAEKITLLLTQADKAWANGDLDGVQTIYEQLAAYDVGNIRAKQGLKNVAKARENQTLLNEAKALMGASAEGDVVAKQKLHQILLTNPYHAEANALNDALIKKEALAQEEKANVKLKYNKPLTLEFREVRLNMLFEALSKITDISFIFDKGVDPTIPATIFAKNMLFSDVLDLVCQTNGLEKKVLSETSVIIYPNKPSAKRNYEDLSVRNFQLEYAEAKKVSKTLRSMLGIRNIDVNERLSSLMIKASPAVLNLAEKVIHTLDRADPEVMLEMEVLEVRRSRLQDLGVDVPTRLGVVIPDTGLTWKQLRNTRVNDSIVNGTPGINFSANDSDVNLLANPRIRVKNREIAKIHVGERVPVFTANINATGVSSQTVQYIDAGLKIEAQPMISSSGDVTIKISLDVNSIGDAITNGQSTAFRVGTRTASTQLRLHDGETQVLAGLIDDQDRSNIDKIAGLGNIPLLGRLFSKQNDNKSKTEIVLSITPRIIRESTIGTAQQNEYWIGAEGRKGQQSASPVFNAEGGVPFVVPKPPPAAAPANKPQQPESLNIPLPAGLSSGFDSGMNELPSN